MKEIELTQGYFALVDDDDFVHLSKHKWNASISKRADGSLRVSAVRRRKVYEIGNGSVIIMHRVIAKAQEGLFVDHVNGNGLDNRRENLRVCSKSENGRNRGPVLLFGGKSTSSRYKGVCWVSNVRKWVAYISTEGSRTYLGYFAEEVEAASAYDEEAKIVHGKFAKLNFA